MSTLMSFRSGASELNFEAAAQYPAPRPVEILGVQDRTAGGTPQYEKLGITIYSRKLVFASMSKVDYLALLNWFINIAEGPRNVFTFIDEYGFTGDVHFVESIINFPEESFERFSGSLTVEYVQN